MKIVPTTCNMPALHPELMPLLGAEMLFPSSHLSQKAYLMRKNIVRLVDKAVYEYSYARKAVLDQISEKQRSTEELMNGRIIYMFGFTNHMENCLNSVRRVLELLKSLKSDPSAPAQDRDRRKTLQRESQSLIKIRNTIEHMGEDIQKGGYSNNEPVILGLSNDEYSICIGSHSLSFVSLVLVLRELHAEAQSLLGLGSEVVNA
ncbi:hypothetical protein HXX02_07410 [Microbulbifer elongatus]|uniref:Uncharacterized protein n=1 Tax=Microbulbifer elongatus TaxID=86173 RepID=A0ABT1NZF7_9GAMM|nr:hypothetical protein [Microbulbifer elongatus]MCQ3829269.1 hypothetical protein [Microbulbifer elongatus]